MNLTSYAKRKGGKIWRCSKNRKEWSQRLSPFLKTFLLKIKTVCRCHIRLYVLLVSENATIDCQFDVNGEFGGVSKKSVSNIYCFCREVCDLKLCKESGQMRGPGKIVGVDKSNFKI